MPLDEGRRIHERQMGSAIVPALNISWYDRFFEHSLAMTTAMDHAFREGHDRLARLISKYAYPLSRTQPIRNSGRRLFSDHAAGIFEETDAIKKRIRSEISALLEVADHQLQELAIDVDQAIRHSRKKLATTIKDAVEGIEKHVGVEIPLPFVERDPGRDRTKSTVSNWAEKFWQTLHHVSTLVVVKVRNELNPRRSGNRNARYLSLSVNLSRLLLIPPFYISPWTPEDHITAVSGMVLETYFLVITVLLLV